MSNNNYQEEEVDERDQNRFAMLGFGNMRQLHEARHGKALSKNIEQNLNMNDEEEDKEIEVLDIMESLKD